MQEGLEYRKSSAATQGSAFDYGSLSSGICFSVMRLFEQETRPMDGASLRIDTLSEFQLTVRWMCTIIGSLLGPGTSSAS